MNSIITFATPWEYDPLVLVGCLGSGSLYMKGWMRRGDRSYWPLVSFYLGLVIIYAVMQTYVDYLAQHMLWVHRVQHLVLHHLGPFLLMLGNTNEYLGLGSHGKCKNLILMPLWRYSGIPWGYRLLQHPVVAPTLFVGLIYFWLIPEIHFGAMLSASRYQLMNWSMLLDGLLFWWLILDPRHPCHGRPGYGTRLVMLVVVVPPQILIGAHMFLSKSSLYTVYSVCGRAWPISPMMDQQIAGLVTWIPSSMMSVIAALVVLQRWIHHNHASLAQGNT